MPEEKEQIKYYRRVIELENWKVNITYNGKKAEWSGSSDIKTSLAIFEFLFEKFGRVEECDYPPTYIEPPKKRVFDKKKKLSKAETSLLDRINHRLYMNNYRIVPVEELDKRYEDDDDYPTMIDWSGFKKAMEGVFDMYEIKSNYKMDKE